LKRRILSLLAALALVAVPAVALGQSETPAPAPPQQTFLKFQGVVLTNAEGTITIKVKEGWRVTEGTYTKVAAPDFTDQVVTAKFYDYSKTHRANELVDNMAAGPGTELAGSLGVSGEDVLPTAAFCVLELWMPGDKSATKPPTKPENPEGKPKHPAVGEDHPGFGFDLGFFSLNYRVRGEVLGAETVEGKNILNIDVSRVVGGPKRFRDEGREVATMDAFVTVASKVVITTNDGTKIPFAEIQVDDKVQVVGRFLRPEKWLADEAGEPTPTMYAKRIKIKNR
jgi:hypothetical protein